MSSISPVALDGVVEQVRTAATVMVEIHANAPVGTEIPSAEVASNAVAVDVTGKRNVVRFRRAAARSHHSGLRAAPLVRIAARIILGLVAIAAAVFGLMQVQNWSF